MDKEQLGFGGTAQKPKLKLNEIRLNGEEGKFVFKKMLEEKDAEGKYPTQDIPQQELEGVVVAVRRKLDDFALGLSTPEFLTNSEVVPLFGSDGREKATVEEHRKSHEGLRTTVVVYFYLPKRDEMVRLNVKGLGIRDEDNKGVNYKGWFQYVFSFDPGTMPSDVMTKVFFVSKEIAKKGSKLKKTFFAMRFEEVGAVPTELKPKIKELQMLVLGNQKEEPTKIDEVVDELKYPEEEIDIKDIPF